MDEQLIMFGGAVKALGDGKVGGYLVRFTTEDEPDLEGEFFDAKTDFGFVDRSTVYYSHGLDPKLGGKALGDIAALGLDDVGVWIEHQLDMRDEYERAIYGMAEAEKLGWSSGTAPHLVEREKRGKAVWLKKWPLGIDSSYTPTPADPGNRAMPLKTWAKSVKDLEMLLETNPADQENLQEGGVGSMTIKAESVNVTINQKGLEGPTNMEDKTMSENVETPEQVEQVETPEPVDVEAIAKAAADAAVKAYQAKLEAEPPINSPGFVVTPGGDEADRALKGNPFKNFGEMAMAVKAEGQGAKDVDKRLLPLRSEDGFMLPAKFAAKATGLSEGTPADGGFLVGTDERLAVISRDWAVGNLINRVSMFPVSANSNGMTFNFENETSRVDGSRRGGVRGYWAAEAGVKTQSQPEFRQVSLRLKKLVALVYATDELMADATALEAYLQSIYPEELMFKAEDSIINGTGAGMPQGVLASGAPYSVVIEDGQTAATVVAENLVKMWTHRDVSYNDYVWLLNQEVEAQLMLMGLAVGVGGVPVYLPPGGFSAAPYGTIFGRPVLPVEYCAALGTVGDIILMAPSFYYMITKGATESASSIHVKFVYDETVWRFVKRIDGTPSIVTPLTPYKGTASSISPVVTLATRA